MPRKPRDQIDGTFHVFARGNAKSTIFRDDADRRIYLQRLREVVEEQRWRCLAYCLMTTHIHLLVEVPEATLSVGMQRLHSRYAQRFNARHGRVGHVFQGRFGAIRIESDAQLCATAAYIARNPVRAGLCDQPEDWRWGSYAATILDTAPAWLDSERLLTFFGNDRPAARKDLALLARDRGKSGVRPLEGGPNRGLTPRRDA